ncbi:PfkB family carbohydrate kinase [Kamptonema cortianum]|nr:PfkB family carbohydrate kinase [Kamptonema cortianum]
MCGDTGETRTNFNVESGDGPPTTFNARGPKILASEWQELLEKCERLFESANWVTLGGSLPQDVPPDSFAILGQLAKECSCRFALDADGEPMLKGLEAGPNLIKPNLREAERILDAAIPADPVSAVEAARAIRAKYMEQNPDMIVALTMGAKGAVMVNESGAWIGDPIEVDSRSTIGAGDSLLGGMIAAIEDGESWETALAWGLAAGAATATTDGTEIGRWEVISKFLPIARVRKS